MASTSTPMGYYTIIFTIEELKVGQNRENLEIGKPFAQDDIELYLKYNRNQSSFKESM